MKKVLVFILILIITPFICGLYGILHDQFTFTISTEYYTKFKFTQFNTAPAIPHRLGAAFVGFYATWWVGLFLGPVLALTGLIHRDWKEMLNVYLKSIVCILIVTIIVGLIGLLYGWIFLIDKELNWVFPESLVDKASFIMVGSMHNFSYAGGVIGLIIGVIYQIRLKKKGSKS